jgi:aldose 1-epimerase
VGSEPKDTSVATPSGEQIEIVSGELRATVVEVGGGLRSLTAGDRPILDGYGPDEMSTSGRGQLLLPWPNRLEGGSYEFDGRRHQLPLTEASSANAIHGLVRWSAWSVAAREPGRVVVEHALHPQPGYPFSLSLAVEYAVSAAGLAVRMSATNVGVAACPFGAGAHPYLSAGTATVDSLALRVPAAAVMLPGPRGIPTGTVPVEGTEYDFRVARPIGATVLDNAFTDLERDVDGLVRVELAAAGGETVTLWADESFSHLMVFTGDPLPDVARRSLAVEPMTCPPNAFRTGEGVVRLEPGQRFTGVWGISV